MINTFLVSRYLNLYKGYLLWIPDSISYMYVYLKSYTIQLSSDYVSMISGYFRYYFNGRPSSQDNSTVHTKYWISIDGSTLSSGLPSFRCWLNSINFHIWLLNTGMIVLLPTVRTLSSWDYFHLLKYLILFSIHPLIYYWLMLSLFLCWTYHSIGVLSCQYIILNFY